MLKTCLAVFSDIARDCSCGSTFSTVPVELSIICFTKRGFIKTPLFAIADTILTICSGVISNLCPKLKVASSTGPTFSFAKKIPFASPVNSIPVVCSSPNLSK